MGGTLRLQKNLAHNKMQQNSIQSPRKRKNYKKATELKKILDKRLPFAKAEGVTCHFFYAGQKNIET